MKLYFHPASTTSRPVALFAADHGIELEYKVIDLFAGEHTQPAFGAIVNERMDWFNTSLSRELCYGFLYPQILPTHKRPDEHAQQQTIAWAKRNATRWLSVLNDRWLGDNRYVCGERLTIADYLGIAQLTFGEVARLDYSRWPKVARWIERMKDRPTWERVNEAFYKLVVQPYAEAQFAML